jgi:hypothetical protein
MVFLRFIKFTGDIQMKRPSCDGHEVIGCDILSLSKYM